MNKRIYIKSYVIPKQTSGVYVGHVSSGRKVYTYAKSQEDAFTKLTNGIAPKEQLKFVHVVTDLEE